MVPAQYAKSVLFFLFLFFLLFLHLVVHRLWFTYQIKLAGSYKSLPPSSFILGKDLLFHFDSIQNRRQKLCPYCSVFFFLSFKFNYYESNWLIMLKSAIITIIIELNFCLNIIINDFYVVVRGSCFFFLLLLACFIWRKSPQTSPIIVDCLTLFLSFDICSMSKCI